MPPIPNCILGVKNCLFISCPDNHLYFFKVHANILMAMKLVPKQVIYYLLPQNNNFGGIITCFVLGHESTQ